MNNVTEEQEFYIIVSGTIKNLSKGSMWLNSLTINNFKNNNNNNRNGTGKSWRS